MAITVAALFFLIFGVAVGLTPAADLILTCWVALFAIYDGTACVIKVLWGNATGFNPYGELGSLILLSSCSLLLWSMGLKGLALANLLVKLPLTGTCYSYCGMKSFRED